MLKLCASPMKTAGPYGRGETATTESWVEVSTNPTSITFVVIICIVVNVQLND